MANNFSDRRVVVTGMGVVTPLGHSLDSFWDNLVAGTCGIDKISGFDASAFDTRIAGEVRDFDPAPAFPSPKEVRRTDRYSQFGIYAAWSALKDSGLDLEQENRDKIGVILGSGIGGLATTTDQLNILLSRGPGRVSPFTIPMLIGNMASGLVSMYFNLRGPNFATCSACATANHAIGEAWRTIKMNDANIMFAGGSEAAVIPIGIAGFCAMRAMSTRNDAPKQASRPFDRDRDGFVMGEGAGVLVLEELEHAQKRGAKIYCEIAGYGNTADAHHLTAPSPGGEGAARCMKMALTNGGINLSEVDYINAHGTSTPQGDVCETQAIKTVFGEHARKLVVSSTKGATGHMLGAAGAVEMAACVLAIKNSVVPPTINLQTPDPDCDLDYVPNTAREMPVNVIVNNSFGFGGHNSTIAARKFAG
jgi:3-oxoacyl-[acyl-carrier-protein] synthase II